MAKSSYQRKQNNKLTSRYRNLSPWKRASLFAVVFGLIGGIILIKSFASTPTYGLYVYNSTNRSGDATVTPGLPSVIGHTGGQEHDYYLQLQGDQYGTHHTWEVNSDNISKGHYMWYGPYNTVVGYTSTAYAHVCWAYIPPSQSKANVTFNISYNSGQIGLGSWQRDIPAVGHITGAWWTVKYFCKDIHIGIKSYPKFEIRVKSNSVGGKSGEDGNSFKLYQTGWRLHAS